MVRCQRAATGGDHDGNVAADEELLRPHPAGVDGFEIEAVFFPETILHRDPHRNVVARERCVADGQTFELNGSQRPRRSHEPQPERAGQDQELLARHYGLLK
jgi:hypothetical protein